jgi:predicted esterase YcpF (UPF0227 family)
MILYIHGFGSSGEGDKAKIFREYYRKKNVKFLAPSLSFIPELALRTLEEIVKNCEDIKLIGSSLGGYYAIFLAKKYNLKAVLINPSINPQITLKKVLGEQKCYYDGESRFCWDEKHIKMLEYFKVNNPPKENLLLLSQKGDETLDYTEAVNYLDGAKMVIQEGGNHSFSGIARYFETIEEFLGE